MTNVTDYRNAEAKSANNSIIDLEILTDEHGWIPTTIHVYEDDDESHIIQIKQWLTDNAGLVASFISPTQAEIDAEAVVQANATEKAALSALDIASIRDIREWVAAQPDAPQTLKDREALAVAARARIQ